MVEIGMVWAWIVIVIGLMVAFPLSVLFLHWKVETYKRELTAALVSLQGHVHVPEEDAVRNTQWNGDKAYRVDLPFDEVERRIHEALGKRRLSLRAGGRHELRFDRLHA